MTVTPAPVRRTPAAVDAVRRSVDLEPGAETVRVISTLTTSLGEPPARLWPLFTSAQELLRWYGPVTGTLAPGGTFTAVGGAGGTVVEAAAPHLLRLTWEYGTNVDDLLLNLDPEDDGGTQLILTHTAQIPREVFERFGPGATALGWDIAMLGLAAHTEGWRELCLDVPAPTAAWLYSDEGSEYVRAWSIRWAAASVAAGTEDEDARRGEEQTTLAYTGRTEDSI